jgi:hypothetical protein
MSERRRGEKEEKEEKGREEKQEKEEKGREEKGKTWDEKWRRDRVRAVVWASILIWAGLVLLQETTGLLNLAWWSGWAVFFIGVGVILLVEVVYRLMVPVHRRPITGSVIFAIILLGIGLGGIVNWNIIWVAVLIAVGLVIILRAFTRQRS